MSDYLCGMEHHAYRECSGCKEIDELYEKAAERDKRRRKYRLWCGACERVRAHSSFSWSKEGKRGKICKECKNARLREWRAKQQKRPDKRFRDNALRCGKCKIIKTQDDFLFRGDGKRRDECNDCRKNYQSKYYNELGGKERHQKYRKTEKGKEVTKTVKETQKKKDPLFELKRKARSAVASEVRSGRIPHPSTIQCHDCDSNAESYDHYIGYEKHNWLNIQAVCYSCHSKRTRGNNAS